MKNKKLKFYKETEEERKERLQFSKTLTTKIVPNKKLYNRKKLKKINEDS